MERTKLTRRAFATRLPVAASAACWTRVGRGAPYKPTTEPYVHPTVWKPFPDCVRLEIPDAVAGQPKARWGFVDVSEAPFRADNTGKSDATAAIQRAIEFARDNQMVCWFSSGVYRVSDTLTCIVNRYQRSNGRVLGGGLLFPCLLVGSRAGKERPRIVLAPRSAGYGDAAKPKNVIYFWARGYQVSDGSGPGDAVAPEVEQPNISFNQMFVGIDIEIGEGNPGAIAVRHQAAEGSAIEDCRIDATHGLIGIRGGIGSGGGSANVTVVGGQVGLDYTGYLSGTQPTPTITGFTLIGQTGSAIRSTSRQTLVAAALRIVAGKGAGPLIDCTAAKSANIGQLSWIDGEAVFPDDADAERRVVIASANSVYLKNVHFRRATHVVENPEARTTFAGVPDGWLQVREAAIPGGARTYQSTRYEYPVYVGGRRLEGALWEASPAAAPPTGLQARHVWGEDFPHWEAKGAANVMLSPYNARGDGEADDTAALQRAIDENETVFLPKGCFRITRTLQLRPNTKLVGIGQHLTHITPGKAEGDFANADRPAPLVRTADAASADTVLAFLRLFPGGNSTSAFALEWRCGGKSIFRAVEILEQSINGYSPRKPGDATFPEKQGPLILVTGHGGGRWYNFRAESAWGHGKDYRHLLVRNNAGPLRFYQFSPQHAVSACATEFDRATGVAIYGAKYEGNIPMVWVHDGDDFALYGHGGNAKATEGSALMLVERTPRVLIANAVDGLTRIGSGGQPGDSGFSTDPRKWSILIDRLNADGESKPRPLERPVLWKRGETS
jgi:hypothetical protein